MRTPRIPVSGASPVIDVDQLNDLLGTVLAGLRVGSAVEDTAYTLEEVAHRTGMALTGLVKDCRAGRLEHVSKGDFRGMTPSQVNAMLKAYTRGGENPAPGGAEREPDEMAQAREASRRAAGRRAPTRKAAA